MGECLLLGYEALVAVKMLMFVSYVVTLKMVTVCLSEMLISDGINTQKIKININTLVQ